jgi:hypothetical protein
MRDNPAMNEEGILPFEFPAVARKKVNVGFEGGMLSSDAGVLLLRGIERRQGLSERLAACMRDRRDPTRIDHTLEEMLRLRMFAIAAGYEDANACRRRQVHRAYRKILQAHHVYRWALEERRHG